MGNVVEGALGGAVGKVENEKLAELGRGGRDSEREEKVGEGGIMGWCRESTHS